MENNSHTVELMNIEKYKFCILDLTSGNVKKIQLKSSNEFTGLYYERDNCLFALFPTISGPQIFYNNKLYSITPNLNIEYIDLGNKWIFKIKNYNIEIRYNYSKYLGIDSWSMEQDIDLFYKIFIEYKTESFYSIFSL